MAAQWGRPYTSSQFADDDPIEDLPEMPSSSASSYQQQQQPQRHLANPFGHIATRPNAHWSKASSLTRASNTSTTRGQQQGHQGHRPGAAMSRYGQSSYGSSGPSAQAAAQTSLVCVSQALPPRMSHIFPYSHFNVVQSECFNDAFGSDSDLVVAAPTGSGKTGVLELTMLRLIHTNQDQFNGGVDVPKMLYIAPIKALCSERMQDWQHKFGELLGLTVFEVTGDTDDSTTSFMNNLYMAHLLICTPEKWDFVSRKTPDIISHIRLVCIDEVHLLGSKRGPCLEAVVARHMIQAKPRLVAVSATVPNLDDVASWLGCGADPGATMRRFDATYRPVPLQHIVYGYPPAKDNNGFLFERGLNQHVPELIRRHSSGRPCLVFCVTKKGCEQTAAAIRDSGLQLVQNDHHRHAAAQLASQLPESIRKYVSAGVGVHNSGLKPEERRVIEDGFVQGTLRVLCTTTTLAQGVNLPAHLVIVKSTLAYKGAGYVDYDDLEMLQMIGRAGRPQFDDKGVAVIMCPNNSKAKWERMVQGNVLLESSLASNLIEYTNTEIHLRTIDSYETAKQWIRTTFLYVRAKRQPQKYEMRSPIDPAIDAKVNETIEQLHEVGMILVDEASGAISSTALGSVMAKHSIKFETMKNFIQIDPREVEANSPKVEKGLLEAISQATEFLDFPPKQDQRKPLRTLATNCRYPLKNQAIGDAHKKAFVMLQCALEHTKTNQWELSAQFDQIRRLAERLSTVVETVLTEKPYNGVALAEAIKVERALKCKIWNDSRDLQLTQLDGIGDGFAAKLHGHRVSTLDQLARCDSSKLSMMREGQLSLQRLTEWSRTAASIPRYEVTIEVQQQGRTALVTLEPMDVMPSWQTVAGFEPQRATYHLLLYSDERQLIFNRKIAVNAANYGQPLTFTAALPTPVGQSGCIFGQLICREYIGIDRAFSWPKGLTSSSLVQLEPTAQAKPKAKSSKKRNNNDSKSAAGRPAKLQRTLSPYQQQAAAAPGGTTGSGWITKKAPPKPKANIATQSMNNTSTNTDFSGAAAAGGAGGGGIASGQGIDSMATWRSLSRKHNMSSGSTGRLTPHDTPNAMTTTASDQQPAEPPTQPSTANIARVSPGVPRPLNRPSISPRFPRSGAGAGVSRPVPRPPPVNRNPNAPVMMPPRPPAQPPFPHNVARPFVRPPPPTYGVARPFVRPPPHRPVCAPAARPRCVSVSASSRFGPPAPHQNHNAPMHMSTTTTTTTTTSTRSSYAAYAMPQSYNPVMHQPAASQPFDPYDDDNTEMDTGIDTHTHTADDMMTQQPQPGVSGVGGGMGMGVGLGVGAEHQGGTADMAMSQCDQLFTDIWE
ncbi:unnamed protein product [Vitrella brassicaformis CCMP3155]|uniref:DNA 3'-5' helicase n=2 Tax=Vitrella brassicaformis TaxID=1169539 RepID=A0A0G4EZZ0_VITBC|nr:unnamed protein product [Vitrella brassicaformis CCMP3155]|eukprot:CEM04626.1 unnamed protein product [Vitrella brassicaformis CCMP3155]